MIGLFARAARATLDSAEKRFARWLLALPWRHILVALPVLLVLTVIYAFMASSGTFKDLGQAHRYADMATGFERGHLYISTRPSPALLAQEDPLHPANKDLWIWDATLYKGRYYFYWGPVPALLLMALKALIGVENVSDQTLTLVFMLGRLYAGAALILGVGRALGTREYPWLVALAIAAFGLSSPIPFTLARPYIYEACLAAGQCFLFFGLALAMWGIQSTRSRSLKFLLAGICWGLAIGSRVTMTISVPVIIAATVAVVWLRSDRTWRGLVTNALCLGTPVAAALAAYAAYNYVRFESVTEFGTTWQLSTQRFVTNPAHVIPNIYSYLFAPVEWSCRFPFVMAVDHRPLASWIDWPLDYSTFELVGGIFVLSAWCWLSLVPLYQTIYEALARLRGRSLVNTFRLSTGELWVALCAIAMLLSMLPVIGLWEASMRYAGDAIGGVTLAAALAAFRLRRRIDASGKPWSKVGVRVLLVALGLHTCVVGTFSGVTSYTDPFKKNNPKLYDSLQRSWSFCASRA